MSLKSIYEVVAIIELAKELKYLEENNTIIIENDLNELGAMTNSLINKLKANSQQLKANSY